MKIIDPSISQAFAKGLAVFSGKTQFQKIQRGKFAMVSSEINDADVSYIDQWFAGHLGGGQEIVEIGGDRYTRVYAGGTVTETNKDDVMAFLKKSLLAAGAKTRFDKEYLHIDGEWIYQYSPKELDEITGMITGKEIITYKNTPVFVHYFIISRVLE